MISCTGLAYDEKEIDCEYYSAEDQVWDDATLNELWEKYHIIYNGGIKPVKIVFRENDNPLCVLGSEDDGTLYFKKYYKTNDYMNSFDMSWLSNIISQLEDVRRKLQSHMKQADNAEKFGNDLIDAKEDDANV